MYCQSTVWSLCQYLCHCYSEQKWLKSSDKCVSESSSNTNSMVSRSVMFSPYSHIANCILIQFGTHQTQRLLTMWFKRQQYLDCCMLLLWEGMDWSVHLKTDISINIQFKKVTQKFLQQNEGHVSLVPYGTNWRNKHQCWFLSTPTDCIWTPWP